MGQLAATGRIVAAAGDSTKNNIYFSDDDGVSWDTLASPEELNIQPLSLTDIGHATKMLCGADSSESLFLLDVYSGEITPIFKDQDRRSDYGFFDKVFMHDGVLYAGTLYLAGAHDTPAIYSTPNLTDWTCVYRLEDANANGINFAMAFNGFIHANIRDDSDFVDDEHLKLSPISTASKTGVLVLTDETNQISTVPKSSFEDGAWNTYCMSTSANSVASQVSEGDAGIASIPNGDNAVRITQSTAGTLKIFPTRPDGSVFGIATSAGTDVIHGSVTIGVATDAGVQKLQVDYVKGDGTAPANQNLTFQLQKVIIQPGEWKEILLPPIVASGTEGMGIRIEILPNANHLGDILIDKAQLTTDEQPSSWQIGGTERATAKYDLNWNTPEKATHIFTFTPFAQSSWYDAITGDFYIRSWRVSATVHAELYYDSDDQKFKLDVTDGVNTDSMETVAAWFRKGQALVFAIQFGDEDDAKIHLSVGTGRTIETVLDTTTPSDFTAFGLADVLVRWGDEDTANALNGTIHDLDLTGVMTASDIVSYIDSLISE
jgi:hypothetical protein